ncbi:hypothetical protein [Imhoffiella purpurea]|uniref:Transmembrane protein n=1 Tax=Imhoffiella purpurea TaxID=1249627 RepID=W9VHI7_9GAMM|nr:hypothetical protein [Imhoffiella purpurea]EXJ16466.1 hypothetical protein D779_0198 [Imhoffiella purpurea]
MMKFQNPSTGEILEVSSMVWLWVLLLGFVYFAIKGVWTHVLGWILFAIVTFGLSWMIYPMFANDIMRRHYVSKGWVELPTEDETPADPID